MVTIEQDRNLFLDYFNKEGFQYTSEVPLITEDKSLLFTNSTIIPWKKYLTGKTPPLQGLYMSQKCLRTHSLKEEISPEMINERSFGRFLGYFNMVGLLINPNSINQLQKQIYQLLCDEYEISPDRIKLFTDSKVDFLGDLEKVLTIENDTMDPSYYYWSYGLNNVEGKGVTFSLKQDEGNFEDVGQLIQIKNLDEVVAYEFALGLEVFTSKRISNKTYSNWNVGNVTPKDFRFKAYLEAISTFGAALSIPRELIEKRHKKEIQRLGKRLIDLEDFFQIPCKITEDTLNSFSLVEFGKSIENFENPLEILRRNNDKNKSNFSKYISSKSLSLIEAINIGKETFGLAPEISEIIYNDI